MALRDGLLATQRFPGIWGNPGDPIVPRVVGGAPPFPTLPNPMNTVTPRGQRPPMPVPPQSLPGRIAGGVGGALGAAFGGMDDPSLTPEQNRQARNQAMLMAGLGMIASDRPGLGAVAEGALMGQQVGGQARQIAYLSTQQERLRQLFADPRFLAKLSDEQEMLLGALPESEALKLAVQIMTAPPPEPYTLGVNEQRRDPLTNAVLAENIPPVDLLEHLPDDFKVYLGPSNLAAYATLPPEEQEAALARWEAGKERTAAAGKTDIRISNTGAQTEEGVTRIMLDDVQKTIDNARTAQRKLASLAVVRTLLDDGMRTGRVQDMTMPLRSVAAELGLPGGEGVPQQQLLESIANQLTLQAKAPGDMPGSFSNRDLLFMQKITPALAKTPEGNRLIVEVLARQAQREIELANLAMQYIGENGVVDYRYHQYLSDWVEAHPLFDDLNAQIVDF